MVARALLEQPLQPRAALAKACVQQYLRDLSALPQPLLLEERRDLALVQIAAAWVPQGRLSRGCTQSLCSDSLRFP